ncbi:hypothetical protein BDFB_001127 [Asbolus verrucosus]|uniref:Hyaluronan-mediated motility receptor C-terminal domain-containing protein n=1 Tax=Asbolus verrucosus TaxID=1661398 RepID=A0A482W2Y6_ASBVE|nr:hypothetical protein BDFB_001127 [Asbolus verrucosus]
MSFSKAKIQRFNEIKECTPSPAKYNITTQEKIKLGIISQSGKYIKKPESQSGSETGSINSTPCFQTPTVPKKKKFLGMSTFKTRTADRQEELREKIVECHNKDVYIKDLVEQIEEMTEKMATLEQEKLILLAENEKIAEETTLKQGKLNEIHLKHNEIHAQVKVMNSSLRKIRQESEALKNENCVEFAKILKYVNKFQDLHDKAIKENQNEALEMEKKNRQEFQKEIESLKHRLKQELEEANKKLNESEAKVTLLEENFKEVSLLTEMQTKEKIDEIEASWKLKLEAKEKESEAILKECQEISEYNIIQSEIEKNQLKVSLSEKEKMYDELVEKYNVLETDRNKMNEEVNNLKSEKHAYELSITTFRDTIEVLKKRLINSDRDVEQLKEELGQSEEKILLYEKKTTELTNQLNETQVANEEFEIQYESTSKIMQNQVKTIEKHLLNKVEVLEGELKRDKQLLNEVLQQHHEQQSLIMKAQETVAQANNWIESLEKRQNELETEMKDSKNKLIEETEEAAEIRKKYIEKSGELDKLAQQYEEVLAELKQTKDKNEELQNLIGPYQQQLEAYDNELKIMMNEKQTIAKEAKDLTQKYADILGHHNHKQKIKHLTDLKVRSSELFEKNIDLESKNFKLNKLVDKLKKEVEDLKKGGKKIKLSNEDKENLGSPKCLKGVQSPGPLKDKN